MAINIQEEFEKHFREDFAKFIIRSFIDFPKGFEAGRVLSREMYLNQSADVVRRAEGHINGGVKRASIGLCEV